MNYHFKCQLKWAMRDDYSKMFSGVAFYWFLLPNNVVKTLKFEAILLAGRWTKTEKMHSIRYCTWSSNEVIISLKNGGGYNLIYVWRYTGGGGDLRSLSTPYHSRFNELRNKSVAQEWRRVRYSDDGSLFLVALEHIGGASRFNSCFLYTFRDVPCYHFMYS